MIGLRLRLRLWRERSECGGKVVIFNLRRIFLYFQKIINFAVRFIQNRPHMIKNSTYNVSIDFKSPVVRNWGYLENWKSTATS